MNSLTFLFELEARVEELVAEEQDFPRQTLHRRLWYLLKNLPPRQVQTLSVASPSGLLVSEAMGIFLPLLKL